MPFSDSPCTTLALRSSRPPVQKLGGAWACLLLGAALAGGCDREAQTRAEAKLLLERLQAISGEGPLAQRKAALDALQQLELKDPDHARARDVCRAAHLQLLEAEAAGLAARKALQEATQAQSGGAALPPERGQAIAADLQRSNDALARSQRDFPKCEQETLQLTRNAR